MKIKIFSSFPRTLQSDARFSTVIHRIPPSPSKRDQTPIDFTKVDEITSKHSHLLEKWNNKLEEDEMKRMEHFGKMKTTITQHIDAVSKVLSRDGRTLVPVGSVATGLWNASDIDLCLLTSSTEASIDDFNKNFNKSSSFRRMFMRAVQTVLEKNKVAKEIVWIENTKVPIIKMKTVDDLSADIQFNTFQSILGTLYIKKHVEYDARIRVLITWLKSHLQKMGLLGSKAGLFSSYHIAFFVLHFINRRLPKVDLIPQSAALFLLEQISWKDAADLLLEHKTASSNSSSACNLTSAELALYLIAYYSQLDLETHDLTLGGKVMSRNVNEPFRFISPFSTYEGSIWQKQDGLTFLPQHFASLLNQLDDGIFSRVL